MPTDPAAVPAATRGDRTRAAVLDAAAADLATHGFAGLRGPRVAAGAGVSEATVWHHFGSKPGLLVAVMEQYYDELVTELDEVVEAADGPLDRLRAVAAWWPARNLPRWSLLNEFSREGRGGGDDRVTAAFRACNRRVTRRVDRLLEDCRAVGVLRADAPLRLLRDGFFGGVEHAVLGHLATGRPEDPVAAASGLLELLLRGAAPLSSPTEEGDLAIRLAAVEARLEDVVALLG